MAQINTSTHYFLTDAIGSVRQMVNASDAVTLAKSYDPYGVVRSNAQLIASPYGYTGEFTESTSMVYLRARHYNPSQGRFMSRDTWAGDASNPMSFNRWNYTNGNPVRRTDPSGHCSGDPKDPTNPDIKCWNKIKDIEITYTNIKIKPENWKTSELESIEKALQGMTYVYDEKTFKYALGNQTVTFERSDGWGDFFNPNKQAQTVPVTKTITFFTPAFKSKDLAAFVAIHETSHLVDAYLAYLSTHDFKDNFWDNCTVTAFAPNKCFVIWGAPDPVCKGVSTGEYASTSPGEDFADSLAAYIWSKNKFDWDDVSSDAFLPDDERLEYMEKLIKSLQEKEKEQKDGK